MNITTNYSQQNFQAGLNNKSVTKNTLNKIVKNSTNNINNDIFELTFKPLNDTIKNKKSKTEKYTQTIAIQRKFEMNNLQKPNNAKISNALFDLIF